MHVKMNENEMKLTIDGLIRLLKTMKDTEFVLSVPLAEALSEIVEGGEADAEKTVQA